MDINITSHWWSWWWACNGWRVDKCTDEQVKQAHRYRKWAASRVWLWGREQCIL